MTKEKTLSEQICELCGLEYEKMIADETYSRMCNHGDPRCTQISSTRKATLNFENPENFVKLLELKFCKIEPSIGKTIYNFYPIGTDFTRKEALNVLIKILTQPKNQNTDWLATIKQAIRNYDDWVWR